MVKEIPLTQGKVALVDDEDYELVSEYNWCAGKNGRGYCAISWDQKTKKNIRLSRLILKPKNNELVDHINGDGLDNRRCNLRIVTRQQNGMNARKWSKKTASKYKGVIQSLNKWQARVKYNYKGIYLGTFETEEDAARAYDKKAKELFGEYACLNFP